MIFAAAGVVSVYREDCLKTSRRIQGVKKLCDAQLSDTSSRGVSMCVMLRKTEYICEDKIDPMTTHVVKEVDDLMHE